MAGRHVEERDGGFYVVGSRFDFQRGDSPEMTRQNAAREHLSHANGDTVVSRG